MALQLMMTLMYLKDSQVKFENIYTTVADRWSGRGVEGHSDAAVALVKDIRENYGFRGLATENNEMLDQLVEQLSADTNDVDLIDTIVRILGLPYVANSISEKTLTSLKKAILLPAELIALKNQLKEQELFCGNCHRALTNGEMVTFNKGGYGNKDLVNFWCVNCKTPDYVACPNCKEHVIDVPVGVTKGLRKRHQCESCVGGVNEVPAQPAAEPVLRVRAGAAANIRNIAMPQRINAANWLNTPIAIRNEPLDVARAAEHIFRDADEHIAEFNRIILNADREGEL
jgi:uncharacterized CHY-type Zn-finger protein